MSSEPDGVIEQRHHLHDAIARLPELDGQLPDGCYLAGWVTIAEFVDPDGSRWFCTRRGTDGGERDLMPWTEKGYLRHAIDGWQTREIVRETKPDDDGY